MLKIFTRYPEVIAALSERTDGSMKLVKGSNLNSDNRQRFFAQFSQEKIISAELVHGSKIVVVDRDSKEIINDVDGLITQDPNVLLSITVADCVPVYFYEADRGIVGIVHSGWRGTVAGVVDTAVKTIITLGGDPASLVAALGPGINACHFEVQADVLEKFSAYPDSITHRNGKIFIDLKSIIIEQLTNLGIKQANIENHPDCTMEGDRYFSFRRDKPEIVETMAAVIGLEQQKDG